MSVMQAGLMRQKSLKVSSCVRAIRARGNIWAAPGPAGLRSTERAAAERSAEHLCAPQHNMASWSLFWSAREREAGWLHAPEKPCCAQQHNVASGSLFWSATSERDADWLQRTHSAGCVCFQQYLSPCTSAQHGFACCCCSSLSGFACGCCSEAGKAASLVPQLKNNRNGEGVGPGKSLVGRDCVRLTLRRCTIHGTCCRRYMCRLNDANVGASWQLPRILESRPGSSAREGSRD